MKVLKPLSLGVLTRPFEVRNQARLGVHVLATIPLVGDLRLHTEQELWTMVPEVLGSAPILDEGIPKSRAEMLVAGRAFPPERPATTCPVEVQLGTLSKSVSVIGDRRWRDDVPTEAEPFESMELSWERAFGGPDFDANPLGVGYAPVELDDGSQLHALPNIEQPDRLIRSPGDRPEPAAFGRIDVTWPQRMRHRGTYDQAWLKTRFPGFADDLDWRMWNLAQEDQQQDAPFVGDEAYRLVNLHPEHSTLFGTLPNLRARVFAIQGALGRPSNEGRPEGELLEVETRLMTVWFFPEKERAVLCFSGALDVVEDDARDVRLLLVAAERIGDARPLDHYDAVIDRRCNKDTAAIEALIEEDLVPEGLPGPLPKGLPGLESENLFRDNQRRARKRKIGEAEELAAEQGTSLEEMGIDFGSDDFDEVPSDLRALPRIVAEKQAELEAMKADMAERSAQTMEETRELCERLGVDFTPIAAAQEETPTGPPSFTAQGERERMRDIAERAAAAGAPVPHVEEMAEDPEQYAQWEEQERQLRDIYRTAAHVQSPAPRLSMDESRAARAEVEAAAREGRSLEGRDFTGVDFSELALGAVDLSDALLESTRFTGAVLDGATLNGVVLAHADLGGASLQGASLSGANLGAASLVGANLEGANLHGAVLLKSDASRARLVKTNLAESILMETRLSGADLSGAQATALFWIQIDLEEATLVGADLTKSSFVECQLARVDLSDAVLRETNFVTCTLDGAKLLRVDAPKLRLVHESSAAKADFRHAKMPGANLRDVDLTEADLSGTLLDDADLSESRMAGANLFRVVARRSKWMRTELVGAQMMKADLLHAFFTKADLRGADLRGASLFGADLALIRGDDSTQLEGANQGRVRVHPIRAMADEGAGA